MIAKAEVVDPIILNTKVREYDDACNCSCCCRCHEVPETICRSLSGALCEPNDNDRYLTISLGIFSVTRIVRPTQYLVNATEYCVPDKECVSTEDDDPCCVFRQMSFPTNEFCPPDYTPARGDRPSGKCGCHG